MSQSEIVHDTDFALCARLVRSLTHLIRGDLSVITNDLTYLGSLVEPHEVERAQARCARVATTLSKLSALVGPGDKLRRPLSALQPLFAGGAFDRVPERATIAVDLSLIGRAVTLLREMSGGWERCEGNADNGYISVQAARGTLTTPVERFQSGSDYAAAKLGEGGAIEGCLVDLILRDHGWLMEISVSPGGVVVEFRIPFQEDARG